MAWRLLFVISGFIASVFGQSCPYGWLDNAQSGSCYFIPNSRVRYNWHKGVVRCNNLQSHLVQIDSQAEMDFISTEVSRVSKQVFNKISWWVGLQKNIGPTREVENMDGTLWNLTIPINMTASPQRQCGAIRNGTLFMTGCLKWYGIVCEREKETPLLCDVDNGWTPLKNSCMKAFAEEKTWTNAKAACLKQRAELTKVVDVADMEEIWDIASMKQTDLWIGLRAWLGNFTWTDLTTLQNSQPFWAPKEPINKGSRKRPICVYVSGVGSRRLLSWMTSTCEKELPFVCRKPQGVCPDGYVAHQTKCLTSGALSPKLTWTKAKAYCLHIGGKLLKLASKSAQSIVEKYKKQLMDARVFSLWIGFSDEKWKGRFPWRWTDGTMMNETEAQWINFKPPPNTIGQRDCGFLKISNNRWSATPKCDLEKNFICELPMGVVPKLPPLKPVIFPRSNKAVTTMKELATTTAKATVPYNARCGQYWEERIGTDFCYQFHGSTHTWQHALDSCRGHGGSLVSITSNEEQSYLEGRLKTLKATAVWIGATDRMVESGWRWEDGQPFAFINWYPGEPNDRGQEDCSAINVATMAWYDYDCGVKNGYICKKEADTNGTMTTTSAPVTVPDGKFYGCPLGWLGYMDNCYLMKRTKSTWLESQLACRTESAHLASIDSAMENKFIWALFPAERCSNNHNHTDCEYWTKRGECGINAAWMSVNCRAACGYCKRPCADYYASASCRYWANIGECKKNPMWMAEHCSYACGCDASINSGYWIGLNDRSSQMTFTWSDLSPVKFTHWSENQPSAHHDKNTNCVMVHYATGKWADDLCDSKKSGFVCIKPKQIMDQPTVEPYKIGCPVGAFGYGARCFIKVEIPKTWSQARDACKLIKGDLVSIQSRVVGAFITSELFGSQNSFWTGLRGNMSKYSWVNGQSPAYTAWVPEHTGNEQNQCVAIRSQRPVGLWEDNDCNTTLSYICETGRRGFTTPIPTTTSTPPKPTKPIPCPDGWSGFGGYCYKVLKDKVTWLYAQAFCENQGGSLPSVHNNDTQNFLTMMLQADFITTKAWIGLSDRDEESSYMWSDGTPFDFSQWKESKPNNLYGTEDCVQTSFEGQWESQSCFIATPFICSMPRGTLLPSVPPTTTKAPSCTEDGWIYHTGFCYFISPQYTAGLSWYQAERKCKSSGGHLASLASQAENDFLLSEMSQMGYHNDKLWIGFNELHDKIYQWSDGSPTIFNAWSDNEPNDAWGGQKCVNFYAYSGRWNDDNCMTSLGYVCKKVNGSSNTDIPVPTPILQTSCPPGFQGSGLTNKCFLLAGLDATNTTDRPLNWTDARDMCRKIASPVGVEIATINNRLDYDYTTLLLKRVPAGSNVWIGLTDREFTNRFMWQDNSEVTLTAWGRDQPNNHWAVTRNRDCVSMKMSSNLRDPEIGRWYVELCDQTNAYLCQTAKVPGSIPSTSSSSSKDLRGDCPATFFKFDKGCFTVIQQKKTWHEARKSCRFFGGDLASITDVFELVKLDLEAYNYQATESFWIGLYFNTESSSYQWSDRWPFTLTSWSVNDPDRQSNNSCVKMDKRLWNDTSCNEEHPFVCFVRNESPPTPAPTTPGNCPDPSTQTAYGDFCYQAKPMETVSWPEAAYLCGQQGMDLASVQSKGEADFIHNLVKSAAPSGGGGGKFYGHRYITSVWIGLSRDGNDGFRWSDDSSVDYYNWAKGEPNSSPSSSTGSSYEEECVEMFVDGGKWNDAFCLKKKQGYVCKVQKILPSTQKSTTKPLVTPDNPHSYTIIPGDHGNKNPPNPSPGRSVQYKNSSSSFSGGQIAGIVLGAIAFIFIATVVAFVARQRWQHVKNNSEEMIDSNHGFDNALYNRQESPSETKSFANSGVSFS